MQGEPEIIAVVLPDGTPDTVESLSDGVATGTMLMVRHADGRVTLEPARRVITEGRRPTQQPPRKRRAIIDPVTREVMGYEFEMGSALA